jgi:ABC-type transporter Mla subunit MlaD
MAVLADLLVRFGADSAELRKTLKTVEGQLKGFTRDVGRMKTALEGAFAVVGIAKAATALAGLVQRGTEAADRMGKLAQASGVAVEDLSKLSYVATLSDVSTEELGTALARLSKNMSEAAEGSKSQAAAFGRLGVAVRDAEGNLRPVNDVLLDIAERFARAEDGAGKAALAQELFGRAGADLIPLLNQGAGGLQALGDEASRFGAIVTQDMAEAADRFGDDLDRLHLGVNALGMQMAKELTPALHGLAEGFFAAIENAGGMDVVVKGIGFTLKSVATVALGAWTQIQAVSAALGALVYAAMQLAKGEFKAAWESLKGAPSDFVAEIERGRDRLDELWHGPGLVGVLKNVTPKEKITVPVALKADVDGSKAALKTLQGMLEDLETKAATFGQGDADVLRYRFDSGDLREELEAAGPLSEAYREAILGAADALAELQRKDQATADAMRDFNATVAEAEAVYDATRTPAERYANEMERLARLLEQGAIDQDTFSRAADAAAREYQDSLNRMSGFTRELTGGMQDVFQEQLFEGFSRGTKGMLDDFGEMLRKMAAQLLASKLMTGILGLAGGVPGLNSLGETLGFGGARADGGGTRAGTTYLVGERGPELFTPNVSGRVIPNDELARGAAGGGRVEHLHRFDDRMMRWTIREAVESYLADVAATRGTG